MSPCAVMSAQFSLQELFTAQVAGAQADAGSPQDALWPEEFSAIAAARPARRREFAAGRAAARAALRRLGQAPCAIVMGADRAPVWPCGVHGSITHSARTALAVVSRDMRLQGLGLDMEPASPLEAALWPEIATESELRWIACHPAAERGLWARALFCAKEAAYKAQYPRSRTLLGFQALELTIDRSTSAFCAQFRQQVPGIPAHARLAGRLSIGNTAILAGAELTA